MGWWKKLKGWQKVGIVIGGGHLVCYMGILFLVYIFIPHGESGLGFLLVFMEWPWMVILSAIGIGPIILGPNLFIDMVMRGVLGSLIYGFFAVGVFGGLKMLFNKNISRSE